MIVLEIISYFILTVYCILIIQYIIGWIRLNHQKKIQYNEGKAINVIVACRNEENNVINLLESLNKQNYPKELTHIFLVNDHSTDRTKTIIEDYIKDKSFFKLLNLPNGITGKKSAISFGVKNSTSEIIITTDADCQMKADWISSMLAYYLKHKPILLSGPVEIMKTKGVFAKFQALEFSSLVASGAGSIGINKAIMCNGANLLFEKKLHVGSNKEEAFASGDDIFLMLSAKKINPKKIQFIKSTDATVYTQAAKTLRDFVNQRVRWTSKSKAYRDFDIISASLTVAAINILITALLISTLFDPKLLKPLILLLIIKSIFDLFILFGFLKFFKRTNLLWFFIPIQIIYPIYISITVIFGLTGNFTWKNRKSE